MRKRIEIASGERILRWLWPLLISLLLGLCGSWVDFHTDEETVIFAFMFFFGVAMGTAVGLRRGVVCGAVMGASLPIYFLIKRKLGIVPSWGTAATEWATIVTIIPSVIGVLLGAGVRKAAGAIARG